MGTPQDKEMEDIKRDVESLNYKFDTLTETLQRQADEQHEQNKISQKMLTNMAVKDERLDHLKENLDRVEKNQLEQASKMELVSDGQKRNTIIIGVFITASSIIGGAFVTYLFKLLPTAG